MHFYSENAVHNNDGKMVLDSSEEQYMEASNTRKLRYSVTCSDVSDFKCLNEDFLNDSRFGTSSTVNGYLLFHRCVFLHALESTCLLRLSQNFAVPHEGSG